MTEHKELREILQRYAHNFVITGYQKEYCITLDQALSAIKQLMEDMVPTGEQLHEWYLEATKKLNPESYNPKAQKPYNELSTEQKFIDDYISSQMLAKIEGIH